MSEGQCFRKTRGGPHGCHKSGENEKPGEDTGSENPRDDHEGHKLRESASLGRTMGPKTFGMSIAPAGRQGLTPNAWASGQAMFMEHIAPHQTTNTFQIRIG